MKFAFHVHTCYSSDSNSKPEDIINYCRKENIEAIAICDHNEIAGALECQKLANGNPTVIIGEEIKTTKGEIIGLFLSKKILKGLSADETIREIKKQNGLVCIPHPGETLRRSAISKKNVEKLINSIDIVEVFNSRTLLKKDNDWAGNFATKNKIPKIAGSDAHTVEKIGCAINEVIILDKDISLSKNRILKMQRSGLLEQLYTKLIKLRKKYVVDR